MSKILAKTRRAFDKDCQTALAGLLKGTTWRKNQTAIFCERGGHFLQGNINVYLNAHRSIGRLAVKPMAIDPILWDIFQLPDNQKEPLSFRAWGAFTCPSLLVGEQDLEVEGNEPHQVAAHFLEFVETQSQATLERLESSRFSELVRQHPNQLAHGAYAISLVCALIAEGLPAEAARVAASIINREARASLDFNCGGKSFFEFAVAWLALPR